jgi:hypothetical protein
VSPVEARERELIGDARKAPAPLAEGGRGYRYAQTVYRVVWPVEVLTRTVGLAPRNFEAGF